LAEHTKNIEVYLYIKSCEYNDRRIRVIVGYLCADAVGGDYRGETGSRESTLQRIVTLNHSTPTADTSTSDQTEPSAAERADVSTAEAATSASAETSTEGARSTPGPSPAGSGTAAGRISHDDVAADSSKTEQAETVIEARGLNVHYGDTQALRDISTVRRCPVACHTDSD
jgi:hypothetical protein